MKVVHLIATLDIGGAESQLLTLAQVQASNGYQVVVLPLKGTNTLERRFLESGVRVDSSLRSRSILVQFLHLYRILKHDDEVLVHAHSPKAQLLVSALPVKLRKRFLISKHDAMPFIVRAPVFFSKLAWRFVNSRAEVVVLISSAIKEELRLSSQLLKNKRYEICHYGISPSEIAEIKLPLSASKETEKGKNTVFGTVGRLIPEKNHKFLIKAFQRLTELNQNCELIICGYGSLATELVDLVKKENLGEKVKIYSEGNDCKGMYRNFDVFVLPSSTEGFGLVLLEAMAASLPIIASRVGGIPEVLGKDCGLLFNSVNQSELVDLMSQMCDEVLRAEQSDKSSARLSQFGSYEMFRNMDSIYRSVTRP